MPHAVAPRRSAFDVALTPPALARVFIGTGLPHETIAVPGVVLSPGEVLVRIELATVCAADLRTVAGHRPAPAPTVLGHEQVGRVMQIGDDSVHYVDGSKVRIGDRVVWSVFAACERCDRCLRGLPQRCRELRAYGHERVVPKWELTGGFATHAHLLRGTALVRAPEHLPAAVLAPATCGAATAWAALAAASDVTPLDGALVLVCGAGLRGLTATAMATARGARVIVSDPDPDRRQLARRFGAVDVADPRDRRSLTRALAAEDAADVDVVIETSGTRAAGGTALAVAGAGGVVILVGDGRGTEPVALDAEKLVRDGVTVRGVHAYPPGALDAAVRFLAVAGSAHPFDELVGATFPLDRLDEALRAASALGAPVRVGVVPG